MGATGTLELIQRPPRSRPGNRCHGLQLDFSRIAMPEHEHWGRVYEGFSEDLELTVKATQASIRGHQGTDLARAGKVAATVKHFLGDGATQDGIEGGSSVLSESLIRERHLPPYQAAVEAGVAAVMVGFNSVNGTNMHHHKKLVQGLLKDELGFGGVVMTDWDGGTRYGPPYMAINAASTCSCNP